jgi:hypothetical protein
MARVLGDYIYLERDKRDLEKYPKTVRKRNGYKYYLDLSKICNLIFKIKNKVFVERAIDEQYKI